MDQRYLNEYIASVNGDSSLTIDSKNLITKHITALFAFAQRKNEEAKNNPGQSSPTGPLPQRATEPNYRGTPYPEGNVSTGVQSPNSPTNRIG